jgi:ABC-2 type transport system ATP-binding protein
MPIIEVENLSKHFKRFRRRPGLLGSVRDLFHRRQEVVKAVDGVAFSIEPGEIVGYIGANGAGKSTTIKMLTGILVPTSGRIVVDGLVPYRNRYKHVRKIGAVFGQRSQLWWDIAVIEAFKLLQKIYEVPNADYQRRLDKFTEVLGLGGLLNIPVRKLSLGQRMRCDLAAALLHNPSILFLDEPTIGLDVAVKAGIRDFIKEANRDQGTTVILATHDLGDIEDLCRRVIMIDSGKMMFDGSLSTLSGLVTIDRRLAVKLEAPVSQAEMAGLLKDFKVRAEADDPYNWRIEFDRGRVSAPELTGFLLSRLKVHDLVLEEAAIEDVVRRIYEQRSTLNVS